MEKKLILPSLRQTPEIKQFSPKEYIENKTIRSSKNVDFRHQNIDKRRTPSPLTGISPIIAANSIFQSPLSYKIKRSDFSNEKIKSKQKNIISFYTLTRKKNKFPPKINCNFTKVQPKYSFEPKISITPSPTSRYSDFSCQIDF